MSPASCCAAHTPIDLIVESFEDPRMDRLVMEQRGSSAWASLRIEKTPRQILRALQENRVVAVAIDRPVSAEEGVPITFFGKTCYVPGGIAQIALKTGSAMVPGYCRYDESVFHELLHRRAAADLPRIHRRQARHHHGDAADVRRVLEEVIRKHPEQWDMFRRFWPEGEATRGAARGLSAAPAIAEQGSSLVGRACLNTGCVRIASGWCHSFHSSSPGR